MKKLTHESVKEYTQNFGYTLLSTKYKNNSTKLKFICPIGHKFWMTWSDFQQGIRCPEYYGSCTTICTIRPEFCSCFICPRSKPESRSSISLYNLSYFIKNAISFLKILPSAIFEALSNVVSKSLSLTQFSA